MSLVKEETEKKGKSPGNEVQKEPLVIRDQNDLLHENSGNLFLTQDGNVQLKDIPDFSEAKWVVGRNAEDRLRITSVNRLVDPFRPLAEGSSKLLLFLWGRCDMSESFHSVNWNSTDPVRKTVIKGSPAADRALTLYKKCFDWYALNLGLLLKKPSLKEEKLKRELEELSEVNRKVNGLRLFLDAVMSTSYLNETGVIIEPWDTESLSLFQESYGWVIDRS